MDLQEAKKVIEAILFVSNESVLIPRLKKILEIPEGTIKNLLKELQQEYELRGIQILEIAGGYQMCTRPQYASQIRSFFGKDEEIPKLSQSLLETLSIIVYKQPITKIEIEQIRGVNARDMLSKLLNWRFIKILGRKEVAGRPLLYGTTDEFLRSFGLANLETLPPIEEFIST